MTDLERKKINELKGLLKNMGFSHIEISDIGIPISLFGEDTTVANINHIIKYLKENPNVTYDELQGQVDILLGLEIEDEE